MIMDQHIRNFCRFFQTRRWFVLIVCAFLFSVCSLPWIALVQKGWTEEVKTVKYACPMHPEEVSDQPGNCSICGMALVPADSIKNVAILIFDGVQIIDYTGPYEVFGQQHFNVFTVAQNKKAITTSMQMSVNPAYDFATAPAPDILLVPGGDVDTHLNNPTVIRWIQDQAKKAQYVLSVCNGAFFLAKAGLLDGLSATTFHGLIDDLKAAAPKTKIVMDQRFVDNGKIITSAGLTSGIDASIYLISKISGMDKARELALHLEYNWQPESNYARANLADKYLRNLRPDIPNTAQWQTVKNFGGMDQWEYQASLLTSFTAAELLKGINEKIAGKAQWSAEPSAQPNQSNWKFNGEKGEVWKGSIRVEAVDGQKNKFSLNVRIWNDKATKQT
jgi:putative intracellular protease/amidase